MTFRTAKFSDTVAYSLAALLALIVLSLTFIFVRWFLARSASNVTDSKEVAEYAVTISPSDPHTHFAAAVLSEKTFLPVDFERSLIEYEAAASLSPSNYLIWIDLGRALDRHGEEDRAETALRKALELAPNYASTKWALGNLLLRHGKTDEGFSKLREAIDADATLTDATVQSAFLWFEGNIDEVQAAIGNSSPVKASLIKLLIREKRIDEALRMWRTARNNSSKEAFNDAEKQLLGALIAEKKFVAAYEIYSVDHASESETGGVTNGGFEEPIRAQQAAIFDWQTTDNQKVQVAIIEGQQHSGARSLRLLFNLTEAKDFSGISQYVAVEPNKKYNLQAFYKSDIKTAVPLVWQIVHPKDGRIIAASGPLKNNSDWSSSFTSFAAPSDSDAVVIRLSREDCKALICPLTGSLFLDDVSVQLQ